MAVSFIQGTASTNTANLTINNVKAGSTLVICHLINSAADMLETFTDSTGDVWTRVGHYGVGGGNRDFYQCLNATAGTHNVTKGTDGTDFYWIMELSRCEAIYGSFVITPSPGSIANGANIATPTIDIRGYSQAMLVAGLYSTESWWTLAIGDGELTPYGVGSFGYRAVTANGTIAWQNTSGSAQTPSAIWGMAFVEPRTPALVANIVRNR